MGLTWLLIALNALCFLGQCIIDPSAVSGASVDTLSEFGALYLPAVLNGEWYRLLTSMFLHSGIIHLASNMYCLYLMGPVIERTFGRIRYFTLYVLAGLGGGVAALLVDAVTTTTVTVGASGAIFGLFGAYLALSVRQRSWQTRQIATNVLLMLLPGFLSSHISWAGHLGGVITGFVVGFLFSKKICSCGGIGRHT